MQAIAALVTPEKRNVCSWIGIRLHKALGIKGPSEAPRTARQVAVAHAIRYVPHVVERTRVAVPDSEGASRFKRRNGVQLPTVQTLAQQAIGEMWHRNRVLDHPDQPMRMIGVGRPIGPIAMPLAANPGVRSALAILSKESIQLLRPRIADLAGNPVPVLSLELRGQCVVVVVTVVVHSVNGPPAIWIQF